MKKRDADRISRAVKILGSNMRSSPYGLKEGEDYTVLAYSDWSDEFVPSIVRWKDGYVDDFSRPKYTMVRVRKYAREGL